MADRTTAEASLRAALGGRSVSGLDGLETDEVQALADAIVAARRRQSEALAAAAAGALDHLPRFARGAIRRIAGGR